MVLQVNYLGDYSLEIFEDPSAMALVEVKVLSSLDLGRHKYEEPFY